MMIRAGVNGEIIWFAACIVVFSSLGFFINWPTLGLVVALLVYIFRLLFFVRALANWAAALQVNRIPEHRFSGVWAEIAEDLERLVIGARRENQRLQTMVSRIQDVTAALSDGVVLVDADGSIDWWNVAAEKLLALKDTDRGYKITNFIRKPAFVRFFEAQNYEEPLQMQSSMRENDHLQFQMQSFGKGERIIIVRNISRMFRLEQMRKDFVANVSHELRTPLTVVRGYLETFGDSPELPAAWQRAIMQMQQQSLLMTQLVNDLITLAKLETDDNETNADKIHLAELVEIIVNDAKVLSGEKCQTFHQRGDDSLILTGNQRELRSAFSNLVFNAVNYSPKDADISIEYSVQGESVVFMVSDTGVGIDPKHIPRLTERFYRVDKARSKDSGGTGLGLAIVKHALLRHQAELNIESRLGVGSTFSCHFPLSRLAVKPAE